MIQNPCADRAAINSSPKPGRLEHRQMRGRLYESFGDRVMATLPEREKLLPGVRLRSPVLGDGTVIQVEDYSKPESKRGHGRLRVTFDTTGETRTFDLAAARANQSLELLDGEATIHLPGLRHKKPARTAGFPERCFAPTESAQPFGIRRLA